MVFVVGEYHQLTRARYLSQHGRIEPARAYLVGLFAYIFLVTVIRFILTDNLIASLGEF